MLVARQLLKIQSIFRIQETKCRNKSKMNIILFKK